MYTYKIKEVVSVYDGDTCKLVVDLGFGTYHKITCRLNGINTPEVRGDERPEGIKSRDWLRNLLFNTSPHRIKIKTHRDKTGKYGRYLIDIYIDENDTSINEIMLKEGLAIAYG